MHIFHVVRQVGIRQRSVVPKFGRATVLALVLATGAVATLPAAVTAQDLSWDTTAGNTVVDGGTGNWDGATANWTGDAGATNEVWIAGNTTAFGGTAGTVTVVGTQETDYITVQTDGYTLQGGALTFSATGSSGVTVETGTTTIATDLTSTNGFNKAGEGTLILSGTNSLAGALNVLRGDLVATNADALADISNLYIQAPDLSPVTADLGGGTVSISNFIVQGNGATGISNGTVSFTGLGQIGNAIVDTTLTGTGNLSAAGGGRATLNAVNTYSGTTTISAATPSSSANNVVVSATGAIRNSAIITNNGTLNVNGDGGNAIGDTATINNSGNFILTGSDETVGSVFGAGNINLNANTLTTGDATNVEISGVISGAGDLVKQGTGTLTLSGTNTYAGGTAINNGVLTTNNTTALGTGTVAVNGGTLNLGSALTIGALTGAGDVTLGANLLTTGGNNASTTYAGVLSGTGGLAKTGSGEMTLTGTNTYSGETAVFDGTLTAGTADAFGTGGTLRLGGGDVDLGGFTITKNSLIAQNGTLRNGTLNMTDSGQFQNATIDAVLTGVGGVTSAGAGTTVLSAANTFTGDIIANSGTFDITGSTVSTTVNIRNNGAGIIVRGNSLADTAAVTISNSGVLTVAADETIGSLASASATASVVLNADLTTGDAGDDTFAGVVSGAGDLIKQGAGTFTVSGLSTGTGTLVNNAGTVDLTGTWAGDVDNTAAGTFTTTGTVSGAVTTAGIMNANSGANLNGLVTVTAGTLNANGALFNAGLTVESGGTLDLDADTDVTGTVNLSGAVTNTGGGNKVLAGGQIDAGGTIAAGAGNTVTLEAGLIVVGNGYSILNGGVIYDGDLRNAITTGPFTLSGAMLGNVYTAAGATTQFTANTNFGGFDLDVEAATANVDIDAGVAVSNVGQFINTGTTDIGAGGSLTAVSLSNEGGAIINLGTDATLTGTGNTTDNAGTVNVAGGGALVELLGDYNNLSTGIVNFNDAAAKDFDVQAGVITNDGTLNFNAGTTVVNSGGGAIQNTATGDINIANNATMDATGDTINNAGTIDMLGGGSVLTVDTLTNTTGGIANAQGALNADVVNTGTGDFNALGTLTGIGSFANEGTATFAVTSMAMATVDSLTNTTTSGTGTTIATFGTLYVNGAIENGVAGGTAASLISNSWNLIGGGILINHAGATLDSDAIASTLAATDVTNNGTMNIQGRMDVDSITNSGSGATFMVVGNTYGGGAPSGTSPSPTPVGTFLNQDGATINITDGEIELATFTNTSAGTGTTLATAGVQVAATGVLDASTVANNAMGTINNAGVIRATTITNAATLTNTGTLTTFAATGTGISNVAGATLDSTGRINAAASADAAAFLNAGTARVSGTGSNGIVGNVTNTGTFTATGALAVTGAVVNANAGVMITQAGDTTVTGSLTNNGTGTGNAITTAGVRVNAATTLQALDIINNAGATMAVAGTLDSTSGAVNAIGNAGTLTIDSTGVVLGAVNNTGTLISVGQINEGLVNTGGATVSNQVLGAIQNNAAGQLTVDADLALNSTLTNAAGGLVDVDAGTVTGLTTLNNAGQGAGSGAAAAGFEIAASAAVNATDVDNTGTMYVAGTLNAANPITNSGTLTATGAISGGLANSGTANLAGIFDGNIVNDGGITTITANLAGTGGAASGNFDNQNGAVITLSPAAAFTLGTLDNDATSQVNLNGGTIDGAVTNAGTMMQSGTVTGAFTNNGVVDLVDDITGDEVRAQGGLISAGSYNLDVDLAIGTQSADFLTITGATTGNLLLQFNLLPTTPGLLTDALLVVDVDDAAANDFSFSSTGLDFDAGPVSIFVAQQVPNGDVTIQTGASLTLGSILEGVAQLEALTSQQSRRLVPHTADICGGAGAWGRVVGGEATTTATIDNMGQQGTVDVVSSYNGFQVGANLGCASELGGWDMTYNVLAGMLSGSSAQDMTRDGTATAITTAMDFDQIYAGVSGTATNGAVTADVQLRFAQTDYDIDDGIGTYAADLGLTDSAFATQTFSFAGTLNYRMPVGQSGFAVVPGGGLMLAKTTVDDLRFATDHVFSTDDYTTTTGFAGVTVNYENASDDGATTLHSFVAANYYTSLSVGQNASLVEASGASAALSTSGVDGYGELSVGFGYNQIIDPNRQFNASLRADTRVADGVEGYNLALEIGLRF